MGKIIADVSVVVANYNNGKFLLKFFDSIDNSTYYPKELIIIDDGSSDDSIAQIELNCLKYSFIKLIKFPVNRGFANALNAGLEFASCKYIMRIDPDDYMAPTRIEKQYNFLESNADIDIVGSNIAYFDSASGQEVFNSNVPLEHYQILNAFKSGNCGIIHGSMMCKTAVINQFKYNQVNVPAEDYELFSLMLKYGYRANNLRDSLTFVRIHINSISNNLPFDTIRKTFQLNKKIWDTKISYLTVRRIHLHLFYYRKFLFCNGRIKYFYLLISLGLNPMKLILRLPSFFKYYK